MILITSWTWFEDVIWVINLFLRLSYDHLFQHLRLGKLLHTQDNFAKLNCFLIFLI